LTPSDSLKIDCYPDADFAGLWNSHTLQSKTDMHIKIHEDNAGALLLGKLEPRRMTPRSKHYAIKYHWFREHIKPRQIELVKISSENQLGDLFTKGLDQNIFQRLRKKLMGW
jgi:hypothetical protein